MKTTQLKTLHKETNACFIYEIIILENRNSAFSKFNVIPDEKKIYMYINTEITKHI